MSYQYTQAATAEEIAENGMAMVKNGSIRCHKLRSTSRIHTGEAEDAEMRNYRDFLPGKNCCTAMSLTGSDNLL